LKFSMTTSVIKAAPGRLGERRHWPVNVSKPLRHRIITVSLSCRPLVGSLSTPPETRSRGQSSRTKPIVRNAPAFGPICWPTQAIESRSGTSLQGSTLQRVRSLRHAQFVPPSSWL
jgi:hypothetical protein